MTEQHDAMQLSRRGLLISLAAAPLIGAGVAGEACAQTGSLGGVWRVSLDAGDLGLAQGWHARVLPDRLSLPGSLETARLGKAVDKDTPWTGDIFDRSFFTAPEYAAYRRPDNFKVPFFLQPETWHRGPAWFQREIDIPADWRGKRVELFLERPHWETQVWVDDRLVGRNDALYVPHVYDLGALSAGAHRLTIRVDNRLNIDIGHNGHGVTDHTQGNWNGVVGRIELRAREQAKLEGVDLYPRLSERTLRVRGRLANTAGAPSRQIAAVRFAGRTIQAPVTWDGDSGAFEAVFVIDAADTQALRPWDEFDPVLHEVSVRLSNGEAWTGRFGWREMTGGPGGFRINGRPAMLRGALDCCIFPLTGHPPTDVESWRRIMRRLKDYGLNHLRFHSYCPPGAAFEAADEEGIYLQPEVVWANQSTGVGDGKPVDQWLHEETDRILAAYGNHPSFVLMAHGNEPGGAKRDAFLGAYVRHYREKDPRRLWSAGAGWPVIADNQFHIPAAPRIQAWEQGLKSRINAKAPETETHYGDYIRRHQVPVVSHEIGQWCVYPKLDERRKYTGHLKARNFDVFEDRLRDSGLLHLAPEFLYASGRLQVLCYKEEIESALRTPGMGGFQLLGLQDFPGQGTALVGVVDPFWDDKGYVSPAEYRRFCAPTVPLARLTSRIVRSGEPLAFRIDVAHFGAEPLADAEIAWSVAGGDGKTLAAGTFDPRTLPVGNAPLGLAAAPVLTVAEPTAARLVVRVTRRGEMVAENDWDIWVYPQASAPAIPPRIRVASALDQGVLDHLAAGGDVLLGVPGDTVANYETQSVQLGFSSIFWNTLWTNRQAPTTLGILCDPRHPGLARFPTDAHSNWHWWHLIHRAGALRLDRLPRGVEPIVRVIDDWFTARPLALVAEMAVGKGRIVVCGFEIDGDRAADPVSRQMRASLLSYMGGGDFRPAAEVTPAALASLFKA